MKVTSLTTSKKEPGKIFFFTSHGVRCATAIGECDSGYVIRAFSMNGGGNMSCVCGITGKTPLEVFENIPESWGVYFWANSKLGGPYKHRQSARRAIEKVAPWYTGTVSLYYFGHLVQEITL